MLERGQNDLTTYAFLLSVELAGDGKITSLDEVKFALADSLRFIEGTGDVEIECLGELEIAGETQ